ncbi:hypothetical protein F6Y03_00120 [Bacillus megaterium]|nr:hypothetical protein [Priestia megaterium]
MKRALTAILAIGLIGTQFYAAFADDSRVPKSAYAKEWTKPKQQNVKETIKTTGLPPRQSGHSSITTRSARHR